MHANLIEGSELLSGSLDLGVVVGGAPAVAIVERGRRKDQQGVVVPQVGEVPE